VIQSVPRLLSDNVRSSSNHRIRIPRRSTAVRCRPQLWPSHPLIHGTETVTEH
jgi:hypothetical protein